MRQDAFFRLLNLMSRLRSCPEHRLQGLGVDLEEKRRDDSLVHAWRLHRCRGASRNLDHLGENCVESVLVHSDAGQRVPELLALANGDEVGSDEVAGALLDLLNHLFDGICPASSVGALRADGLAHTTAQPRHASKHCNDAPWRQSFGEIFHQVVPVLLVC